MIRIAPSILSADFSCLRQELTKIESAGADMVHLDIMDGHFVPTMTIGPIVVEALRPCSKLPFDAHLMVENPDRYIKAFKEAGADGITIHAEATPNLGKTIAAIKSLGLRAGVAINPGTKEDVVFSVLNKVDMVLVMTVNPGYGGQKFIEGMEKKIRNVYEAVKSAGLNTDIEVDGGINTGTIGKVLGAGANVIVTGSAFFRSENPKEFIADLRMGGGKA